MFVLLPLIVPFDVVQLYVLPGVGVVEKVVDESWHALLLPVTDGFGNDAKEIFCVTVVAHPALFVWVTLMVPDPPLPQVTLSELELETPLITPPETVHE